MRWIRVYSAQPLKPGERIELEEKPSRHLTQVLRLRVNDRFTLFNGDGFDYAARLVEARKKQVVAEMIEQQSACAESPLSLLLGQAIIKGDRMDWLIQKTVELGVNAITPLMTDRVDVRLKGDRVAKRVAHWQGVAISACEQCGRAVVPRIETPRPWHEWADAVKARHKLALIPGAEQSLADLALDTKPSRQAVAVAVGPEGGWSDAEVSGWTLKQFTPVHMGPRVLRAETAGISGLAVLQGKLGDF